MKTQIIEQVDISQARDTIAQAVKLYFARDQMGRYRMERRRARPICLIGPAGIGKTEIVRQVAEEQGLAFVSYSITHHTRQSIIGLPRLVQSEVNGNTVYGTEYTRSEIIAQVERTIRETGREEGILFLDEFNCASESIRPIMLQLLQDKSFGPHPIPPGFMLVLAGNPPEYNRSATTLDAVTADRMRMIYVKADYPAWRAYAKKHNIHPVILSYLDNHRENFYVYRDSGEGTALVTARAWEDLSVMMTYMEQAGQKPDLAFMAQYLQSGDVARSFFKYYRQYEVIISSGILDEVLSCTPQALRTMQEMSFEKSWSLLSALLRKVQNLSETACSLEASTAAAHAALKPLADELAAGKPLPLDERLLSAADQTEDRPARDFLNQCVALSSAPDGWEQIRQAFAAQMRQPRSQAFRSAAEAITAVLRMTRKAWKGKPHVEFLFNNLCDSTAITQVITYSDIPEFRALCTEDGFNVGKEAQALMEKIEAARRDHGLRKETL